MQKPHQCTSRLFMVRPANFGYNHTTAASNSFQSLPKSMDRNSIKEKARGEFDKLVETIRLHDIIVDVHEEVQTPILTDSVFPNNWFSTHYPEAIVTFPMCVPIRRAERKDEILAWFDKEFVIAQSVFLHHYESESLFLEGTGSLILDRVNKVAFANRSIRTDEDIMDTFCSKLGYEKFLFEALDDQKKPIYHTNVIMSIGTSEAIICLECIPSSIEQNRLVKRLEKLGKTIIDISFEQVKHFCGNIIEVSNTKQNNFWVMSSNAFTHFNEKQLLLLTKNNSIVHSPIPVIETVGGGGVRCMIAENFLTPKNQ